jgi:putative ABC transport system substrate-binding protein
MKRCNHVLLSLSALLLTAAFWTIAGSAQTTVFRVGILNIFTREEMRDFLAPFYRTLGEHGWVEGKNVIFAFRDSGGDPTRLAEPAAELVRLKVDVLFTVGAASVRAAFAATRDIPIVAHDLDDDPVDAGYAQSYGRPGRNVTGYSLMRRKWRASGWNCLRAQFPAYLVSLYCGIRPRVPSAGMRSAMLRASLALGCKF